MVVKKVAAKKSVSRAIDSAIGEDKKWRAQSDLRTIQEAKQIAADKSRMSAAQAEAKSQMAALQSVTKK